MPLTNAERADRYDRISNIATQLIWVGLLMLAARLVGDLTALSVPELFGPLGMLLALPAAIVSMLTEQLADRYRESDAFLDANDRVIAAEKNIPWWRR